MILCFNLILAGHTLYNVSACGRAHAWKYIHATWILKRRTHKNHLNMNLHELLPLCSVGRQKSYAQLGECLIKSWKWARINYPISPAAPPLPPCPSDLARIWFQIRLRNERGNFKRWMRRRAYIEKRNLYIMDPPKGKVEHKIFIITRSE